MKDHVTALARLAHGKAIVCVEQPDWTHELLLCLAAISITVAAAIAALASSFAPPAPHGELAYLRERARDDRTAAVIRIVRDGRGFRCLQENTPAAWHPVIDAQCELLGALLQFGPEPR